MVDGNEVHFEKSYPSKKTQLFWPTAVNDIRKLVNGISNTVCPKCSVFLLEKC
jgi:hypothetical protein